MTLVSRSRTIYVGNGRNHIGKQSDLHKLYPYPSPYKSFAELFQKRPFPSFPRPLVPKNKLKSQQIPQPVQ